MNSFWSVLMSMNLDQILNMTLQAITRRGIDGGSNASRDRASPKTLKNALEMGRAERIDPEWPSPARCE
jgi:hypothetical protein